MNKWKNCKPFVIIPTKTKKLKKCMVPNFNANTKFKLSLRWLQYVDIKKLSNNKVGNFKAPSHKTL
jgi:hypothetical protein